MSTTSKNTNSDDQQPSKSSPSQESPTKSESDLNDEENSFQETESQPSTSNSQKESHEEQQQSQSETDTKVARSTQTESEPKDQISLVQTPDDEETDQSKTTITKSALSEDKSIHQDTNSSKQLPKSQDFLQIRIHQEEKDQVKQNQEETLKQENDSNVFKNLMLESYVKIANADAAQNIQCNQLVFSIMLWRRKESQKQEPNILKINTPKEWKKIFSQANKENHKHQINRKTLKKLTLLTSRITLNAMMSIIRIIELKPEEEEYSHNQVQQSLMQDKTLEIIKSKMAVDAINSWSRIPRLKKMIKLETFQTEEPQQKLTKH